MITIDGVRKGATKEELEEYIQFRIDRMPFWEERCDEHAWYLKELCLEAMVELERLD